MGRVFLIEGARWAGTLESLGEVWDFVEKKGTPGVWLVVSKGESREGVSGGRQRVQGSAALEKAWDVTPRSEAVEPGSDGIWVTLQGSFIWLLGGKWTGLKGQEWKGGQQQTASRFMWRMRMPGSRVVVTKSEEADRADIYSGGRPTVHVWCLVMGNDSCLSGTPPSHLQPACTPVQPSDTWPQPLRALSAELCSWVFEVRGRAAGPFGGQ